MNINGEMKEGVDEQVNRWFSGTKWVNKFMENWMNAKMKKYLEEGMKMFISENINEV